MLDPQNDGRIQRMLRLNIKGAACCLALTMLVPALIMIVLATALPYWLSGDITRVVDNQPYTVSRSYGLFQACGRIETAPALTIVDNCEITVSQILERECTDAEGVFYAMDAMQIMAILMIVLMLCTFCVGFFLQINFLNWVGVCFLAVSSVLVLVVCIVFVAGPASTTWNCRGTQIASGDGINTEICPDCNLGASWYLNLVAGLFLLCALCFAVCLACMLSRPMDDTKYYNLDNPGPIPRLAERMTLRRATSPTSPASPASSAGEGYARFSSPPPSPGGDYGVAVLPPNPGTPPPYPLHGSPGGSPHQSFQGSPRYGGGSGGGGGGYPPYGRTHSPGPYEYPLEDPLLARCEQVRGHLQQTLMEDAVRSGGGVVMSRGHAVQPTPGGPVLIHTQTTTYSPPPHSCDTYSPPRIY